MATTRRLADWRPYPFALTETRLRFDIAPLGTRVEAELDFRPLRRGADLVLDGAGLRTLDIAIDGVEPAPDAITMDGETLTIAADALPARRFTLSTTVEIHPERNTALEGLYLSGGIFCTQCEAEGFRHITWYPDRPDVMAPFRVQIRSDEPVLLSNGNPVSAEPGLAEWHDPWPKPSYLFALVAGDLDALEDRFTTMTGREVALNVWVRPGDLPRAGFAMEALKKSMAWDERVYGREYDLDVFNIVAVDDFNMGAMENKGLNIFNSKLVLASPDTATDLDYERIEAVIAHEYFHNWTGNRITCRDWFQLCLKEGLTVFRDQQFTSDVRSAAVKRIEDVVTLRSRQFREDAGPLAHPPRPDHYEEINNFYTATVYEKGAEVIGMLKRLVGDGAYRAALDLYFDRHDGQACTIEDWLKVFEDVTGRDLTQFKRWYTDAGTPRLTLAEDWDEAAGRLTLRFSQSTRPTPGQPEKPPRVIPVALGLISQNGDEVLPTQVLEMTEAGQEWSFDGLGARPVVSLLRGFSAPVTVERQIGRAERAVLLAHDTDPFARWEAGHDLAMESLVAMAAGGESDTALSYSLGGLLTDTDLDPAFVALILRLPSEDAIATEIAARGSVPDPDSIHAAREALAAELAAEHKGVLEQIYAEMDVAAPYEPSAEQTGARSLRLAALALLSRLDGGARAQALWDSAGNMTEKMGALADLVRAGRADGALAEMQARFGANRLVMDKWFMVQAQAAPPENAVKTARKLADLVRAGRADGALAEMQARFGANRLVMDKWFMVQVQAAPPENAVKTARKLADHQGFEWTNPNRFRSLVGGLAANHAGFHAADGSGYDFVVDWLIRLDPANPQTAARMLSVFETWTRYDAQRRDHARAALSRLAALPGLSRNSSEMVTRVLAAGR